MTLNFFELIHDFWLVQSIGAFALIFVVLAWNARTRNGILHLQTGSIVMFIIHYALLGAVTGAVMNSVGLIRNIVSSQKDKAPWAHSPLWMYLFIFMSLVLLVVFWQGWPSILPALGIMLGTFAIFRDNPKDIRFYMFLTGLVWIPYTIIVHSYSGLVTQVISTIGLAVGMHRLDK